MSSARDEKVWVAEAILRYRSKREEVLPSTLFAEQPWEALLHLFIADANSERLDGHDLARLTSTSPAIMSRWIKHLAQENLIEGDGHGEMDTVLVLNHRALDAIELFLAQMQELGEEFTAVHSGRKAADGKSV